MKRILHVVLVLAAVAFAGCDVTDAIYDAAYEVKITDDGNGSAAAAVGGTDITEAEAGATVTLTATPNAGYKFSRWVVESGGAALLPDANTNPATFTMPSAAVEIKAEFEATVYAIILTNNGSGSAAATVGGEVVTEAREGDVVTLTATAASQNYVFNGWVVESGNAALSPDEYSESVTFTMPSGAVSVKAEFRPTVEYVNGLADAVVFAYDAASSTPAAPVYTFSNIPAGGTIHIGGVSSGSNRVLYTKVGDAITIAVPDVSDPANRVIGAEIEVYYALILNGVVSEPIYKTVNYTGVAQNVVGAIYYDDGVFTGVVYREKTGDNISTRGLVLHKEEGDEIWSTVEELTGAGALGNGESNTETIKTIAGWETKYPAFKWAAEKGTGWYLPALAEMVYVYYAPYSTVNAAMQANGGDLYNENTQYWTSTEIAITAARYVNGDDTSGQGYKSVSFPVRSVLNF